jgi:hypothetical protein
MSPGAGLIVNYKEMVCLGYLSGTRYTIFEFLDRSENVCMRLSRQTLVKTTKKAQKDESM